MAFNDDLMKWRQHKDQQRIQAHCEDIAEEIRQNEIARNDAFAEAARSRPEDRAQWDAEADHYDVTARRLYSELQQYVPPPGPDPRAAGFFNRRKAFVERFGPNAIQAIDAADRRVTLPKNPQSPLNGGMGIQRFSPAYYRAMDSNLELYGEQFFGAKYDPSEKTLTADEAARISGLSPQAYNNASRQLANQGRFRKG